MDGTFGTCSSATICYVYDAKGMRVRRTEPSGSSEFIRDLQGNVVSDMLINFGWSRGYVYLGSQFLAQYGDGTTYFVHADHLGSTRLMTKLDQSIADSYDYVPFGEGLYGGGVTQHRFTGYERDIETGKDYARARYYAAPAASFLTPDPAGTSATCLLNPQTQNRYAYVTDNPLNETDPTGLCGDGDNSDCGGIGISIPFFPGGGGAPPAPPTPHPVFTFEFPLFSNTEQQDPQKPLPFGTTRGSCIRNTKSPEKHGLLGIFKQYECEYTCTFDGPGAPYSADLSTNWTRWGTLGVAVKKQYGKYTKYCPMAYQADFDYQVYEIGGGYYTIYSIEQIRTAQMVRTKDGPRQIGGKNEMPLKFGVLIAAGLKSIVVAISLQCLMVIGIYVGAIRLRQWWLPRSAFAIGLAVIVAFLIGYAYVRFTADIFWSPGTGGFESHPVIVAVALLCVETGAVGYISIALPWRIAPLALMVIGVGLLVAPVLQQR